MNEYYKLWTDESGAMKMLNMAVRRYVELNLDAGTSPSDEVRHFVLDPEHDAIEQLVEFYEDLLQNGADRGEAMLSASGRLYELASTSSPPRYFSAWIYGVFLLRTAPNALKPQPDRFLRFLRPLLESDDQRRRDLYFGALFAIGELSSQFRGELRSRCVDALFSEWDYLQSVSKDAPASLARLLCQEKPKRWATYLAAVCEAKWPAEALLPRGRLFEFASAAQALAHAIDTSLIASTTWELASFLSENRERGRQLMSALFVRAEQADKPDVRAPFVLIQPDADELSEDLRQWRIARRGATQRESFPIEPGELDVDAQAAYNLQALLVAVACPVAVVLGVAYELAVA